MSDSPPSSLIAAIERAPDTFDRRKSPGRRRGIDRRRRATSSIGIEISPSGVSLAIIQETAGEKKYSLTTDHVAFEPTSGPYQGDWSTAELCTVLTALSEKHKLSGQAVSVGLGGEPCVTRAWKGDNEEVDASIRELTERSHRYLSLGHGEKVCCYAEKPIDAKRKRAWVTVARRGVIDAVALAVDKAGMRLTRLEHSLSALCQAIGHTGYDSQQPVLVVTTGFGRADLGISYRGQLILDYRPARLGSNLDSDDQVWSNAVAKHIKCLRRYLQKQLPRGENSLEKICLPGRESVPTEVAVGLREHHDLETLALSIREFTRDMELKSQPCQHADTMTAIWLAQSTLLQRPKVAADLMESLQSAKKISLRSVARLTWPLAACLLLTACLQAAASWEEVGRRSAERELERLQLSRREYDHLHWKLAENSKVARSVQALHAGILGTDWINVIKICGRALPEGTWLKSITIERNERTLINGASLTNDAIYEYLSRLKESKSLVHVTLLSTKSLRLPSGPAIEFEISAANVESHARSSSRQVALSKQQMQISPRPALRLSSSSERERRKLLSSSLPLALGGERLPADHDGGEDYSVFVDQAEGMESNG